MILTVASAFFQMRSSVQTELQNFEGDHHGQDKLHLKQFQLRNKQKMSCGYPCIMPQYMEKSYTISLRYCKHKTRISKNW
uniref:Uncharacterized protein n=1 Tax=Rhizophora mucronata TaxID=61149 RepID=A0A2P2KU74_RHIMU